MMLSKYKDLSYQIIIAVFTYGCVSTQFEFSRLAFGLYLVWVFIFKEKFGWRAMWQEKVLRGTLLCFAIFIGFYAFANFMTGSLHGLEEALHYIERFLTGFMLFFMCYKRGNIDKALYIGALLGIIVVSSTAFYDHHITKNIARGGIMGHHNKLGGWTILILPFFLLWWHRVQQACWLKWCGVGVAVLVTVTLLSSPSRGGTLGGLLMLVLYLVFTKNKKMRITGLLALGGIGLVLGAVYYTGMYKSVRGGDFERIMFWRASWQMFLDYPLFGLGNGRWGYYYMHQYCFPLFGEYYPQMPHNIIFCFLTDVGLVGSIGACIMLGKQVQYILQKLRAAAVAKGELIAMGLCIVGMLAHGMVDAAILAKYYIILYSFLWAVTILKVLQEEIKEN